MRNIWWWSMVQNSDMRWPCDIGFHVPLGDERDAVLNIIWELETLDTETVSQQLYLPSAWAINVSQTSPVSSGFRIYWYYWTSTPTTEEVSGGTLYKARMLLMQSGSISMDEGRRAFAYPIRPFKDIPVVPDSSWTVIYDWSSVAAGAWIYRDVMNWLISLSSDWETWITMADKNAWATQVWTYTISASWYTAAKCGNFYVRWNNYPRPWSASSTYSPITTTKIDASWYWPGNYFKNGVIVRIGSSPDSDWSSVQNDNLWWWESQWTRWGRA